MVTKTARKGNGKVTNRLGTDVTNQEVVIRPLNLGKVTIKIRGTSPLVTHNFGPKARREMLENQITAEGNKAKKKKPRCPEEEFMESIYWVKGEAPEPTVNVETGERTFKSGEIIKALKKGVFGQPATGLKNAIVSACRNTDLTMTKMMQTLNVKGTKYPDWLITKSPNLPIMDNRICRLANGSPIERFRPRWDEWETDCVIIWDKGLISLEGIANLMSIAGYFVGLCEGRPEKCALGWGQFEIVDD